MKMKFGLSCVCAVLICQVATSQVHFGVKGGMNLANTVKVEQPARVRIAGYFGGKVWLPLGGKFSLSPELLFTGKGFRRGNIADDEIYPIRLNYIAAPIMFDYLFDTKTRLSLGAEIEYLLSAKQISDSKKHDLKEIYPADFDLGLCAGIDHQISKTLHIDIRYVHGVTKIHRPYSPASWPERYEMDGYNRVFQIGLIYDFH